MNRYSFYPVKKNSLMTYSVGTRMLGHQFESTDLRLSGEHAINYTHAQLVQTTACLLGDHKVVDSISDHEVYLYLCNMSLTNFAG